MLFVIHSSVCLGRDFISSRAIGGHARIIINDSVAALKINFIRLSV